MTPQLPPPALEVLATLDAAFASVAEQEHETFLEGMALLATLARERESSRWAAATPPARAARPAALWLLSCPRLASVSGGGARVFLQGRGRLVYLRVVGRWHPDALELDVGEEGAGARRYRCRATEPGGTPFALDELNGAPESSLWLVDGLDPGTIFSHLDVALVLRAEPGGATSPTEALPALPKGPRLGFDDPDEAEYGARALLQRALRAYHDAEADELARVLARLAEDRAGDGPRAFPGRDWSRRLSRWQALWLRAMTAELERLGAAEARRYGAHALAAHPQVGRLRAPTGARGPGADG